MAIPDDPVLVRFRAAVQDAYGNRLKRLVLFGSRARGDSRPDSDYDVAVFLRSLEDRWHEFDRLADIGTDLMDRTGAVVHAVPFAEGAYRDRTSLMREIRREGVDL